MTKYICSQLSSPDVNGLQNCIEWVDSSPFLAITIAQASQLGISILVVLAIAWGIKQMGWLIQSKS